MHGLHLIADLHDCRCPPALLCDAVALRALCLSEVKAAGLRMVGDLFHSFAPASPGLPAGVTGTVLLAESHLALHSWPELGLVTLDIYVCNRSGDAHPAAHRLATALQAAFAPAQPRWQTVRRDAPAAFQPAV